MAMASSNTPPEPQKVHELGRSSVVTQKLVILHVDTRHKTMHALDSNTGI